jgi:hypothetical protein
MADLGDHAELPVVALRDEATRLRVHHLLVMIAFAAAGLTGARVLFSGWHFFQVPNYWIAIVAVPFVLAAELGPLSLFVLWWRFRKRIRVIEPGEWAAIIPAVNFVVAAGAGYCFPDAFTSLENSSAKGPITLILVGFYTSLAVVVGRLILTTNESRWWKIFYTLLLIDALLPWAFLLLSLDSSISYVDLNLNTWLEILLPCALVVTVVIATFTDARWRRQRRWTHWFGVVCYCGLAFSMVGLLVFDILS